jgi:outer membrane protein OmpA-like peptidoglycan-associated protein
MRESRLKTRLLFVQVFLSLMLSMTVPGLAAEQCAYKFDNVILVFDRSGSMLENQAGSDKSKFVYAGDIASSIAGGIPSADKGELFMGLKVFGFYVDDEPLKIRTALVRQKLDRELLTRTIKVFKPPKEVFGFITPLARSLEALRKEANQWPGRTAVLIISDGQDTTFTGKPVEEARLLKEAKNDVAIFAIWMSGAKKGRRVMEEIASAGGGKFIEAAEFFDSARRQAVLREIFLECVQVAEKPEKREKLVIVLLPDPDGKVGKIIVTTPKGTQIVSESGYATALGSADEAPSAPAPIEKKKIEENFGKALAALPDPPVTFTLYFGTNSIDPTNKSRPVLSEITAAIKSRKSTDITIAGHTDRVASNEYNRKLSRARAARIAEILISMGIDRNNIEITFYGEDNPLIQTEDNVAEPRNRRVEVTVR